MRFDRLGLYIHKNFVDVAVLVLNSWPLPSGTVLLKIRWMTKSGSDLGHSETVKISPYDKQNWYRIG